MTSLSAADLQKRHRELEGTPDPFPAQDDPIATTSSVTAPNGQLDTESEQAFPSLAPTALPPTKVVASGWGVSGPRIQSSVLKQNTVTDTFTLAAIDLSKTGKDGKPTTLGGVMKQVMTRYSSVKVEASTNQKTRQTTFHLRSESGKDLEKAKGVLIALLSPVISITFDAPASTISTIIGPKGATLNKVREQTGVRVDIPRKETLSPRLNGDGALHSVSPVPGENDEELSVPITINGPQPRVYEAQAMLKAIVATKTAKTTQRVRDIPAHLVPFVNIRRPEFLALADGIGEVDLSFNPIEREVTVNGDREVVSLVIDKIKATIESLRVEVQSFPMTLPKRQHRLLVGKAVDEIMAKSKCGVAVPRPEDPSEEITVWGAGNDLASGMAAIMQKANSQYIHEFPLPGPITVSKQLVNYMKKVSYAAKLSAAHSGISVYTPPPGVFQKANVLNIEIIGEKPKVDAAVDELSSLVASLLGGTKEVNIDWLVHRVLMVKNVKKIKQFHEVHNVLLFFPAEAEESSSVLLVYDPTTPNASLNPVEKTKHLLEVEKELLILAREVADVKSEILTIDKKWHNAISGKDGTTLNAIIGEDKTLSIKIGVEAGQSTEDVVLIRGASEDVARATKDIEQIIENAKNDEIDNSYTTEFEIGKDFVRHIVGAQGSAINKLRETLGVKTDISDDVDEKDKEVVKKKKGTMTKSKVKITGRKENVEEAKRRILAQVERLADETLEVLKIPTQYHASLIGQNGKYVIRLEEKYAVKITFSREFSESSENKTKESLKSDEVIVKGGKKGVAGAKSELLEALEFEKESNNTITFTVPTRSIPRILGRAGSSINDIKDETGAQIDVTKSKDDTTQITCRGTKKAISAAKTAIMTISDEVKEEINVAVQIENKFHRTIIGAGGQGLKELVTRCGGPTDPRILAGLIRFPRQGEVSDEIRIRGEPVLVKKVQAELLKMAEGLRDNVVLLVKVPNAQHSALIGRGGQHLRDLQTRTGAQVQFPGSRSYALMGEPQNASDFKDVDAQDLIKISGKREACEKAIKELESSVRAPIPDGAKATVSVPNKYHHMIVQQGNFFKTLRSFGVHVDTDGTPTRPVLPQRPASEVKAARIDDPEEESLGDIEWQVIPNYENTEGGESLWTLKARDDAALERAQKMIAEAVEQAEKSSLVGFLTFPDRSSFPRIVGTKGANVSRLRAETGADITVSRDNSTITIVGSEEALEAAKSAIIRMNRGRNSRRND